MNAPVMIMAGGTGGHIFPGLAVARVLQARDVPVIWLGASGGLENRLVPAAGLPLEVLDIGGLRGKGWKQRLATPWRLLNASISAWRLFSRYRPRSVLSMGGYAAGPGGLVAWLRRTPLLVHEQNTLPGLTNKVLARLARRVLTGFPGVFRTLRCVEAVGNPVRAEIAALPPPAERLARREGPLRLLVLGGSQGARALNRALPKALAELAPRFEVRHQSGVSGLDETRAEYQRAGIEAQVDAFIDDMAAAYAWADLVVCRSGALTVAELTAVGLASILVPFPFAVDDHQTTNAEFLREAGAARLHREGAELHQELARTLNDLQDRNELLRMAEAARSRFLPQAAEKVADACLKEGQR
ncbi:undecaprenyldiphospho-muramoylpentapeptide beta-N-acetylglucosaminyltransferase [Pseudomarimonas arenosa]|uniref:UDP-N-acetylglucosamine--N-acetylmuramyl-(pentapeptide) pyrophosphoryl-undecaprenol N-acetylglucosamine transferase n=1 Tax=Pseudomarimonas arenosa TaxID=2774145 RepID=A0AAW3ZMC4_9GAMM|nr:undecaprenyldiphospho-muramoylpentapeptide beta-N-acetylglucosaminyltransferase [Pseudomarimonas arenosa]MBD8525456.1 undecaprenyldiphospho-muramoylpentapeptide beta-N-acetylglucosaminyltransferase [Pseudomarimonas arenosa]